MKVQVRLSNSLITLFEGTSVLALLYMGLPLLVLPQPFLWK